MYFYLFIQQHVNGENSTLCNSTTPLHRNKISHHYSPEARFRPQSSGLAIPFDNMPMVMFGNLLAMSFQIVKIPPLPKHQPNEEAWLPPAAQRLPFRLRAPIVGSLHTATRRGRERRRERAHKRERKGEKEREKEGERESLGRGRPPVVRSLSPEKLRSAFSSQSPLKIREIPGEEAEPPEE